MPEKRTENGTQTTPPKNHEANTGATRHSWWWNTSSSQRSSFHKTHEYIEASKVEAWDEANTAQLNDTEGNWSWN